MNVLTQQLRSQWHKLKETKDGNQQYSSIYLVASFNHWFPIKMQTNLDKEEPLPLLTQQSPTKV